MSSTESTFRTYTPTQAAAYAAGRGSYNPTLYSEVLRYHESTGGLLNTLLDCGCGPGNATRDLATHFQHAMGVDPGSQMIETARSSSGTTASGEEIGYDVATAEDLERLFPKESVDLVTAAMAVCYFFLKLVLLNCLAAEDANLPRGTLVRHVCLLARRRPYSQTWRYSSIVD